MPILKFINGTIRNRRPCKFVNLGKDYYADEIGVLKLKYEAQNLLEAGNVGYIISGIKSAKDVKVGDTITHYDRPCDKAIEGFVEVKPMVFAGIYPIDADDYEELRASLEKLQLNDASLSFVPESSAALGFGFRCGFLGLLHMEIVQERLDREFNMDVINTVPNVSYQVITNKGETIDVHNPSGLARSRLISISLKNPILRQRSSARADYVGPVMKLCIDKRGVSEESDLSDHQPH